jgi:hypothetical protein
MDQRFRAVGQFGHLLPVTRPTRLWCRLLQDAHEYSESEKTFSFYENNGCCGASTFLNMENYCS